MKFQVHISIPSQKALSLTIQMYQICTPKGPRILNPTYHLTLSQTETETYIYIYFVLIQ
jgi:hypothetical protein